MSIGLLLVDCFLSNSLSLKDKRRIINSISQRVRRSFNVALCEVDYQDQWQRSKLAIVLVNTDWRVLQQNTSRIIALIESDSRIDVLSSEVERIR